jgi:hypothetical protein
VNGSREADRVTGVVVTALAADGAQLRKVHVTLSGGAVRTSPAPTEPVGHVCTQQPVGHAGLGRDEHGQLVDHRSVPGMSSELGRNLRTAREAAGVSLAALACRTHYSKALSGHLETGSGTSGRSTSPPTRERSV